MALMAGIRSTASSGLGLDQLPSQPGSMMASRTASAQLGYMFGALIGGLVLAVADFGVARLRAAGGNGRVGRARSRRQRSNSFRFAAWISRCRFVSRPAGSFLRPSR